MQRRRDLDARQVGISVVRCMGSRVSLHCLCGHRQRVRQVATPTALARDGTCTPTASFLRTNGHSGTSTRRCSRGLHGVCSKSTARTTVKPAIPWRSRILEARVPQAHAQFHLVGESQRRTGPNIFQGGFLGLDNIGVFDRSSPLPTGGFINQADGTSWMAMYCVQPVARSHRTGTA